MFIKKRIGALGRGKRGGYRVIIAHWAGKKAFFIYGYAKNVRVNVEPKEVQGYKQLAKAYSGLSDASLQKLLQANELIEV